MIVQHRNTFNPSQQVPFADFIRSTRRLQIGGQADELERAPLFPKRQSRVSSEHIVLVSGVCLWVLLVISILAVYWNVSSTLTAARAEFRPYAEQATASLARMIANADHAMADGAHIVDDLHNSSESAMPAISSAIRQGGAMVDRLERLAHNPVLQIQLANGAR